MKKYKFSLGLIILFTGLLALVYNIYLGKFENLFWICYISLILIGFGTLKKDYYLISSQLNILTIPLIFWIFDFFILLFFNLSFGISKYWFSLSTFWKIISLYHILILPLSFLLIYNKKFKKDSWKLSFIQITIIFFITIIFTSPSSNINCVFKSCISYFQTGIVYQIIFLPVIFIMIFFTSKLIHYFLERYKN